MPVHKELAAISQQDCELQAKDNMLFAGTAVVNGHCFGIVNSTGMATEIGKIQQQIHDAASEEEDTPLKKKLDHFGELLAQVSSPTCQCFQQVSPGQPNINHIPSHTLLHAQC